MKALIYPSLQILFLTAVLVFSARDIRASQIDLRSAETAAQAWLKRNPQRYNSSTAQQVASVQAVRTKGKLLYYTVTLSPTGFLIMSPDESLAPVIAFSDTGTHVPNDDSPLYMLIHRDITARLHHLPSVSENQKKNAAKWTMYLENAESAATDAGETIDIRVEPLLQSVWGQEKEAGYPCYNYYTPPGSEPDADPNNNIRCGCVATAMAQVMRYHQHPAGPVGVSAYIVKVNGISQTASTRGGDGYGGPYQWHNMPTDPNQYTTDSQRQAIGAICHDAGVTVNMSYSPSGSGASMRKIIDAFSGFFQYSCAVYGIGSFDAAGYTSDAVVAATMPMADINQMINPGLDAGYPSILGIDGPAAGHAIVVDGYRYEDETLYHHLNMGWYGRDNVWYALPDVNSMPSYDIIDACVYNIFPDGSGEIVSGRVLDAQGLPVVSALVSALLNGTVVKQSITNEKGIYALAHLDSEQTYVLRAEKEDCRFSEQVVYVGKSTSQGEVYDDVTGNVWGADFLHPGALPPIAISPSEPNIVDCNSVRIILCAVDEGLPNPPGRLVFIIESLPEHGRLYDPNFVEITNVPYTLQNDSNSVIYDACGYFFGVDRFSFKANDGGVPPEGGDSNTAEVLLDVREKSIGQTDFYSDYPFYTWKHDSRMQVIYTAAEFGRPRLIGGISLNFLQSPPGILSAFRLRLQHTALKEYPLYRDFVNYGWTEVYCSNAQLTGSGWKRFDFSTPFMYNGRDNILLDISFNNSSYSLTNGLVYGLYAANHDMSQSSDSFHGDPRYWTVAIFGGYLSDNIKPSLRLHRYLPDLLTADFNRDCRMDLEDLLLFVDAWLSSVGSAHYSDVFDIGNPIDQRINAGDFGVLASEWLECIN